MNRHAPTAKKASAPRLAFGVLIALVLFSACGGPVKVSANSKTNNTQVSVNYTNNRSLAGMEGEAWDGIPGSRYCGISLSRHAPAVRALLAAADRLLAAKAVGDAPTGADLLDHPPRGDNRIGVYLCTGLTAPAYTIHRSVFVSVEFIEALAAAAPSWGGEAAFQSALAFVLYHEVGHAALGHSAAAMEGKDGFTLPEELAADQYAYDTIGAAGIGYGGVEFAKYQAAAGTGAAAPQ